MVVKHLIKIAADFDITGIPAPEAMAGGEKVHVNRGPRNYVASALRELSLMDEPDAFKGMDISILPEAYANTGRQESKLWHCSSWYGVSKLLSEISKEIKKYPDRKSFLESDYWKDIKKNWDQKVLDYKVQEINDNWANVERMQRENL